MAKNEIIIYISAVSVLVSCKYQTLREMSFLFLPLYHYKIICIYYTIEIKFCHLSCQGLCDNIYWIELFRKENEDLLEIVWINLLKCHLLSSHKANYFIGFVLVDIIPRRIHVDSHTKQPSSTHSIQPRNLSSMMMTQLNWRWCIRKIENRSYFFFSSFVSGSIIHRSKATSILCYRKNKEKIRCRIMERRTSQRLHTVCRNNKEVLLF